MNIRPIRNDADHAAALKEIEQLWDAPEGSEDADRLEVLAILVEDYEARRWPIPHVAPLANPALCDHRNGPLAKRAGAAARLPFARLGVSQRQTRVDD